MKNKELSKYNVLGVGVKVLAVGAAATSSVRRGWGCPMMDTASSSRLQRTHRREQLSPSAMGLRKGKMLHGQRKKSGGEKRERVRNNPTSTKLREGGGGGGAPGARAETPLQPLERPHGSRFPDRNCGLWRTCTGEDPFFLKD